jgi:hypothetical protein
VVSKALEHAPREPDHAAVLADLDPELHRLPLGIPAGRPPERRLGKPAAPAILLGGAAEQRIRTSGSQWDGRREQRSITRPTKSSNGTPRADPAPGRRGDSPTRPPRAAEGDAGNRLLRRRGAQPL